MGLGAVGGTPGLAAPPPRPSVAELAVLGVLVDQPTHGYELRQRLSSTLGSLRAYSFGSLYPLLRRLESAGLVDAEPPPTDPVTIALTRRRTRIVYRITAAGRRRLTELLGDIGPLACSDDGFEVHLALFGRTCAADRVRLLQGRRRRVEERREGLRAAQGRAAGRLDSYTEGLRRLRLEAAEREVRWLGELLDTERCDTQRCDTQRCDNERSNAERSDTERSNTERSDTDPDHPTRRAPTRSTPTRKERSL